MEDQTPNGDERNPMIGDRSSSPSPAGGLGITTRRKSIDSQSSARDSRYGIFKFTAEEVLKESGLVDVGRDMQKELIAVKAEKQPNVSSANRLVIDLKDVLASLKNTSIGQGQKIAHQLSRCQRQQKNWTICL